jgi:diguanylate cyclase (GGDEF)-like protein/PAS domain S-box-containing protein
MTGPRLGAPAATFDLSHFFGSRVALFSITGDDGYFKRSNPAFELMLGWTEPELLSRSFYEMTHPQDITLALSKLAEVAQLGHDVSFDTRFLHKDGRYRWLAWAVQGTAVSGSWYATARDITEQKELYEALQEVQQRLELAMSMSESGSWSYDVCADQLILDESAASVMDVTLDDFGGHLVDLLARTQGDDRERVKKLLTTATEFELIETDFRIAASDGSPRYIALRGRVVESDRRGRPGRAVGITWNVTKQKQMEQQLLDLVMNDQLTGLKSRRSFDQTLRNEWRRSNDSGRPLAVVMLDVDDFKQVNDTFGHQVGDDYLTSIGRALASVATRPGDVAARYGGEEFIVLLPECGSAEAQSVANRLLAAVRHLKLQHPDGLSTMTISVGVSSVWPSPDLSMSDIIRAADAALYQAKADGKDTSVIRVPGSVR